MQVAINEIFLTALCANTIGEGHFGKEELRTCFMTYRGLQNFSRLASTSSNHTSFSDGEEGSSKRENLQEAEC